MNDKIFQKCFLPATLCKLHNAGNGILSKCANHEMINRQWRADNMIPIIFIHTLF